MRSLDRGPTFPVRRRRLAFSLIEAVFASFLLLTALAMSVYLLNASLRSEANNERRILATLVAESALEEVRATANLGFDSLGEIYSDRTWSYDAYPDHEIRVRARWSDLFVPCSELESQYPYAPDSSTIFEPVKFQRSIWKVQVDVRWSSLTSDRVTLVSHVADWRPAGDVRVRIAPRSGPFEIAQGGTREFRATVTRNGAPLKDIVLNWYVEPIDGYGSVSEVSRTGDRCVYRNIYRNYDGSLDYAPGRCDLVVRGVFQGVEISDSVRIVNQ